MEKELIIYTCLTGFAYDAMEEARKAGARGELSCMVEVQ